MELNGPGSKSRQNVFSTIDRIENRIDRIVQALDFYEGWSSVPQRKIRRARIMVRYLPNPPKWTQIWVNTAYCRFFGCTYEQAVNRSTLATAAPTSLSRVHHKLMRVMRQRIPLMGIEPNCLPDGTVVRVRWIDIPIISCAGTNEVVEMLAIADVKI